MPGVILLDAGEGLIAFILIAAAFVGSTIGASCIMLSHRPFSKLAGGLFLLIGLLSFAWIVLSIVHST